MIYGNYLQNYNQPSSASLTVGTIPAESYPGLTAAQVTDRTTASQTDGLHVKGNRTYEVGVAYIDAFGRQGAMLQNGTDFNDDGSLNVANAFRTNFHQDNREALTVTINSEPPSWADSYRYYIKDVSQDYHSLISYNIYNDGGAGDTDSEFIWIEFQSTDRNKVFEQSQALDGNTGTVLVLRRSNATVNETKTRFLVQDIENEAPEDVRRQVREVVSNTTSASAGAVGSTLYNTSSPRPTTGNNTWIWDDQDGNLQIALDVFNRFISGNQGDTPQSTITTSSAATTVDMGQLTAGLYMRMRDRGGSRSYYGNDSTYVQVTNLSWSGPDGLLTITMGPQVTVSDDGELNSNGSTGWPGRDLETARDANVDFITTTTSDEAIERLGGRFWVRTARNGITTAQSEFSFEGELVNLQQFWFETEPVVGESNLDLFWETSDTFCVCTDHGYPNKLNWFNCVSEVKPDSSEGANDGGVYLESTRINDRFNTPQLVRGVRVNVPQDRYAEERRAQGLTWSGIYNSRTGINRLNEFITADGITKELEPNYGSLQKLHTRDTNLIALTEDKVFRIQADKDQLFNADGSSNVTASNAVLGQTIPIIGEYGISTNPESFATYGHNVWFSDAKRGVVCQYTPGNGQIFEISQRGMDDFYRDRLRSADRIIGMYDDYTDAYVLSTQGYDATTAAIDPSDAIDGESGMSANVTAKYETTVEGWPSFMSFIPDMGGTINNRFYTFSGGNIWQHNSDNVARNNFYGTQYASDIEVIFNDNPSAVKEYLTLSYEGTPDWQVVGIDTESQDSALTSTWPFVNRENKYFASIVSQVPTYEIVGAAPNPVPSNAIISDDGQFELRATGVTQDQSGVKGFYNNVHFRNSSTSKAELFAINTENYISSN